MHISVVTSIAGAPGDGAKSLATAIEHELASRGVARSGKVVIGAYRVQALVTLGQASNGRQSVYVEWTVINPAGKKLGNVEQFNEVSEELFDDTWRTLAQQAAGGILMLLPK